VHPGVRETDPPVAPTNDPDPDPESPLVKHSA